MLPDSNLFETPFPTVHHRRHELCSVSFPTNKHTAWVIIHVAIVESVTSCPMVRAHCMRSTTRIGNHHRPRNGCQKTSIAMPCVQMWFICVGQQITAGDITGCQASHGRHARSKPRAAQACQKGTLYGQCCQEQSQRAHQRSSAGTKEAATQHFSCRTRTKPARDGCACCKGNHSVRVGTHTRCQPPASKDYVCHIRCLLQCI